MNKFLTIRESKEYGLLGGFWTTLYRYDALYGPHGQEMALIDFDRSRTPSEKLMVKAAKKSIIKFIDSNGMNAFTSYAPPISGIESAEQRII